MVGATLACALAEAGIQVAVLEPRTAPVGSGAGDYELRVSAVTLATQRLFQALGAWEGMCRRRVSPFREMRVWDAEGSGAVHFDSAELGEQALGYIIENDVIHGALTERFGAVGDNVRVHAGAVQSFERGEGGVTAVLEDGHALRAQLLVGADGADSHIRSGAGIAVRGWAYRQTAVVATVRPERHHQHTAWQRFMPAGPLAFLPLQEGLCSIIWSTTPEQADALMVMEDEAFCESLAAAFEHTLGGILSTSPRASFPLRLQHAQRYVGERVALVGDAAHTIHPLAGQGANLGFMDAAALAQVLAEGRSRGWDLGEVRLLRRYERWRKGENLLMMSAMDGFKRLFGSRAAPLRLMRNAGLVLFDRLPPVKQAVMRRAMGLEGDLPRLARAAGRGPR